jgi:hypothetical protein
MFAWIKAQWDKLTNSTPAPVRIEPEDDPVSNWNDYIVAAKPASPAPVSAVTPVAPVAKTKVTVVPFVRGLR